MLKEASEKKSIMYKEEQRLLINSNILNSYPKVKEIISSVESIKDIKDIEYLKTKDNESYKILVGGLSELVKQAQLEWYKHKYEGYSLKPKVCELCGNPKLRYIYKIKNKENNIELIVGSECIDKFQDIKGNINGMSASKHKRIQVKNLQRINRISEFHDKFGSIEKITEEWRKNYNSLEILTTKEIDDKVNDLIIRAKDFYNNFINGKYPKARLHEFQNYLVEQDNLREKYNLFVKLNKNNELICDRRLAEWLTNNNLSGIRNLILLNNGVISKEIARRIYSYEYIKKYEDIFIDKFGKYGVSLTSIEKEKINFQYRNNEVFQFEMTLKDFMSKFAFLIYNNDELTLNYITENINIKYTLANIDKFINTMSALLRNTPYSIKLYYYNDEIRVYKGNNHTIIKMRYFINKNLNIIFANKDIAKETIIKLFSKLNNWISKEDKEKYDIGNISETWSKQ